jgi:hypothetical protein
MILEIFNYMNHRKAGMSAHVMQTTSGVSALTNKNGVEKVAPTTKHVTPQLFATS